MRQLILLFLCVLVSSSAFAVSEKCQEGCYCGSELSNLTVTLPPGLKVSMVCGLYLRSRPGPGSHIIDLTREKLSLDRYYDGDYPYGEVYLSGTMQTPITGTVSTEEGPAGSLWFNAKANRRGPVFWEYHLKSLTLGSAEDYKKLRAPTSECWEAEATIKIRNPIVTLGDTDEAGTRGEFDVIQVSDYERCVEQQGPVDPVARLIKDQPEDVTDLMIRINGCNYLQGDWPYAEEVQKKQIATDLATLKCSDVPGTEKQIREKYAGNAKVIEAIDAVKRIEY